MFIGPAQFMFLFILFTGLAGWWRGWLREIITLAITLGSVLFLLNGGIIWLWRFIFFSIPQAFNQLFFGTSGISVQPLGQNLPKPNPFGNFFLALSFILTVGLGYLIGHRYGARPTLLTSRLIGFILGAINGIVIVFYATKQLFWGNALTINTPNSWQAQNWLTSALGCGLGLVAVVMFITLFGRAGGGH
jgi:hypothetical protein